MADAGTDNLREYAPEGGREDGQSRRAGERHVNYAIRKDSIGYRLLKKAGWKENAGLGAHGQGRKEPLPAFVQLGNQGLGFGPSGSSSEGAGQAAGGAAAGAGGVAGAGAKRPAGPTVAQRMAEAARAELAAESLPVKVKRHRQVARQEKEDARGRAIQRYLFTSFNEHDALVAGAPLSSTSRLSATNPLLDT